MRPFYPNIVQYVPKKLHLILRLAIISAVFPSEQRGQAIGT